MKKMILAALVAVASLSANAQVWLGGEAGFNVSSHKGYDRTDFSIMPEIGYSLNDKWDLAVKVGYEYSKIDSDVADILDTDEGHFVINPYARYTFYTTGKVGFFLDGGFSIKTDVNDETAWGIGIRPGVKFAASDKITLVAHLGGLGYEKCGDDSSFGLGVTGNALSLGLYYAF